MTERQIGVWNVQRSIVDRQSGAVISCAGQARLYTEAGDVRYDEAVIVALDGAKLKATQTYRYHQTGAAVTARFVDGRLFFETTLAANGSATAVHYCADDVYTGTFALGDDRWEAQWVVSGTKALQISTAYTRIKVWSGDYPSTIAPYVSGRRSR